MQRHYRNLTKLFAALLPACGESIDEAQFSENLCDDRQLHALAGITPAEAVTSIELREAEFYGEGSFGDPVILDQAGVHCSAATDMAACQTAVADAPLMSTISGPSYDVQLFRSFVFTRGDTVGTISSQPELLAFLGSIDTPAEAALWSHTLIARMVCDAGNDVGEHADGYIVHLTRGSGCGEDVVESALLVHPDGTTTTLDEAIVEEGDPGCSIGRLPAGLCRQQRAHAVTPVGAFLAQVAELEAASIHAFIQLARELHAHGAPTALVRAAMKAAADEVRHARTMTRHARRYGGAPKRPIVAAQPVRSLVDIALDNAVEGCVRETYGAASAHLSARTAGDSALRRAFTTIAREETQHAALSWALDEYFATRLSPAQRRRVMKHRRDEAGRLEPELTAPLDESVHVATGLPRPAEARRIYRAVISQRHQST